MSVPFGGFERDLCGSGLRFGFDDLIDERIKDLALETEDQKLICSRWQLLG